MGSFRGAQCLHHWSNLTLRGRSVAPVTSPCCRIGGSLSGQHLGAASPLPDTAVSALAVTAVQTTCWSKCCCLPIAMFSPTPQQSSCGGTFFGAVCLGLL